VSEGEIAKAGEYRKTQSKVIRLPSGFYFKIRKMSPLAMAKLMDVYGDTLPPGRREPTPEETEKMRDIGRKKFAEILKAVLPECIVEPKVSLTPASESELSLDDIASDDVFALLDEITTFSGLGARAAAIRESFREK